MTKLLISAWMLMVGFAVQAQVYTEFNMAGKKPSGAQYFQSGVDLTKMDMHQYENMIVYTPKVELKEPRKAEPGDVTLTFNLVYDPMTFLPPFDGVYIYNEGYYSFNFWMGMDVITATVPPGTYDFAVRFQSMEKGDLYWVIREQVEVTKDATFTLSAEEAVNHISFVNYGPDGNVLKHALWGGEFDEETGEPILLEEGDVDLTIINNHVLFKGSERFHPTSSTITNGEQYEEGRTPNKDFYVNDVSDRYVFTQSRICSKGPDLLYLSYFSTDDVHAGVIESNPEDYVLCHEDYQFSPYGQSGIGYAVGTVVQGVKNGKYFNLGDVITSSRLLTTKPGETYSIDVYNCIPFEDPSFEGVNLLVEHWFEESYNFWTDPWGNQRVDLDGYTCGVPYTIENGQKVFKNIGHLNSNYQPTEKMGVLTGNGISYQLLPAPEAFTYPAEKRLGIIGDNCPINAVSMMSYYEQTYGERMTVEQHYVGLYGETRHCDVDLDIQLNFNGEEIENPLLTLFYGNGIYEYTITNNNIIVDGLQGKNETVIHYDRTNEECTFPGIEMLQFKSDAGITNRFATAADGTMEFMGGDFKFNYYPDFWGGVYECQPMEVTVEYSPYGEENWRALAVEEVPELFQMPGWGYFYRASLADVTGKATQGWFDVRFKLQDEVGNWQEQVVSPAFRIDDLISTAVEEVAAAVDVREVARYSVDGRQLSAPQPGLNIIRMSDGTSRKVWVK